MTDPTNAELLKAIERQGQAFKDHAKEDHDFQKESRKLDTEQAIFRAETEGKLAKLDQMPTTNEVAAIVEEALGNIFKSKGKTAYAGLLIVAGVVGALVVIGGGLKSLLAWIGFAYLK
jgi:hypothetical protein